MATYKEIKGVTVQTQDTDPQLNVGSFSSGGSMDTDRARLAGDGIQTALVVFGGTTPSPGTQLANTELWNGTAWTEIADVATARYGVGGQGTTAGAVVIFGGNRAASDPAGVTTTEEFTAALTNKTITVS